MAKHFPIAKFAGHLSAEQLKSACAEKGWEFDDYKYRHEGSDYITFRFAGIGAEGQCIYNTFNGRFFGKTVSGIRFNTDFSDHDHKRWFRALLNFVYVSKPRAEAA